MKINWRISLLFYPIVVILFCLDFYSSFIFHHNVLAAILVLLAVMLAQKFNAGRILLILFFLALESFFFYGRSFLFLIYLIPVIIMIFKLRDRFWDQFSCMIITLLLALLGQFVVLEFYMLDGRLFTLNHLLSFVVNFLLLIVMMAIS